MRCPTCVQENLTSRLDFKHLDPHPQTVERFFDKDGNRHIHDHTVYQTAFSCSNNHHNIEESMSRCPHPGCEWNDNPLISGKG